MNHWTNHPMLSWLNISLFVVSTLWSHQVSTTEVIARYHREYQSWQWKSIWQSKYGTCRLPIYLFPILLPSFFSLFSFIHLLYQILCRIKDTLRCLVTNKTSFWLLIMSQGTGLAKIMSTFCHNRVFKWFSAYKTCKWKVVIIITINFILMWVLLVVISRINLSFKLPAMFIVTSIM